MTIGYTRPTKAIIDCEAIRWNIKKELAHCGNDEVEIFAVVKADGYGHGAVKVAQVAREAGATGFCVSLLDEALELRYASFVEPILVLGIIDPRFTDFIVKNDISVTVASLDWLQAAMEEYKKNNETKPLRVHLKIDTGMGRLGFRSEESLKEVVAYIQEEENIVLEGVFTHFSKADSQDETYLNLQKERFTKALKLIPTPVKYIHTANSATALWRHHWQSNVIRLGISMYGVNPSGNELEPPYELREALSLETEIVFCKKVCQGESIGYGAEYTTEKEEWIGTLPIGYADGFIREYKGFSVLVNGEACEIVGRICMDQCMIRLPKEVKIGTKVTIFGRNGLLTNSIQDGADYVNTIGHEVACILAERVPRIYINE